MMRRAADARGGSSNRRAPEQLRVYIARFVNMAMLSSPPTKELARKVLRGPAELKISSFLGEDDGGFWTWPGPEKLARVRRASQHSCEDVRGGGRSGSPASEDDGFPAEEQAPPLAETQAPQDAQASSAARPLAAPKPDHWTLQKMRA